MPDDPEGIYRHPLPNLNKQQYQHFPHHLTIFGPGWNLRLLSNAWKTQVFENFESMRLRTLWAGCGCQLKHSDNQSGKVHTVDAGRSKCVDDLQQGGCKCSCSATTAMYVQSSPPVSPAVHGKKRPRAFRKGQGKNGRVLGRMETKWRRQINMINHNMLVSLMLPAAFPKTSKLIFNDT